ncbi:AEC family transporter [Sphingobacterium corticis]|uniref:AEC family transporter n=1 Tax=Sphingobacterium corticis TaxID=1812823 RepID=A0ABW5NHR7_9SPHI
MDIIKELATRVLPLYGFILVGWFAHAKWNLQSKWISKALLYVLIPILIIENLLKADLAETAISGSMIFLLALAMNIPAIITQKKIATDYDGSLLKGAFSYYNIGWFGIPVVMALFGEEQMPLIISAYVGNALYGDTVGFYLMSRTKDVPTKTAIKKVFQIPAIYACAVAIGLNLASVEVPEAVEPVGHVVSWLVSALGMLIIGVTLGGIDFKKVAYKTFSKILGMRYVAGAIFLALLVFAESQWIGTLEEEQSMLMLLMASFPIAANLVVFASFLETEEENAALLVGISSIVSLILVPLVSILLF